MKKLISLFIVFVTFLGVAFGTTVYVDANYPANGDGTSWSSPYTNLQTAVTAAAAGDLVLVTNGVYSPISTGNKAITIQSVEGSAVTSIDGGGTSRCATLGTGVVLKGFTVFNGYTTGNGGGSSGGTLTNCVISGNTAKGNGGGANGGTLTGCTISGNTTDGNGGGSHQGTLTGCTISGNTANRYGGGSYESTLTDCVISNNVATLYDGGGSAYGTLTGCVISGNTAKQNGGGSFLGTLTDCVIFGNTAVRGGGGIRSSVVYNSAIYNNTATVSQGAFSRGIYYNCTIYSNTAPDYAVGYSDNKATEPLIYNCVIYGNVNTGPNIRQLGVPLGGIFYCSSIDSVDKFNLGADTPTVSPVYGNPRFTNPANNDLTLLPTSPCIDKGANEYVTTATDLLGRPRIHNGTVDMGAYELQSASRFVTTPNALYPMGTKDVGH